MGEARGAEEQLLEVDDMKGEDINEDEGQQQHYGRGEYGVFEESAVIFLIRDNNC